MKPCPDDKLVPTLCGRRDEGKSDRCPETGPEWFKCRLCGRYWFDDELKTRHGGTGQTRYNPANGRYEFTEL